MLHKSLSRTNFTGVYYALTLLMVVGVILLGSKILHVDDPTWALISGVICTEFELNSVRAIIIPRIFATIAGATIAALLLYLFGPNYFSLLFGTILICLFSYYVKPLRVMWKLATATGLIVLIAGLQTHSLVIAEMTAFKRALEVIAGSLVAGIISILLIQCKKMYH